MKIEAQSKEKGRKWERIIKKESYKIELNTFLEWKNIQSIIQKLFKVKRKIIYYFLLFFCFLKGRIEGILHIG